jgi:hypothetical protein
MSLLALTLPWHNSTPLHTPPRNLVADASDSLAMSVTLVYDDTPSAPPADLITGPTFPIFTLTITYARDRYAWDYGRAASMIGSVLWTGTGVIDTTLPGTVNFTVPIGTMQGWPERCGWTLRVAHDATRQDTLSTGFLHLAGTTEGVVTDSGGTGGTVNSDSMAVWFSTLPTTLPPTAGLPWNDGGVLAFS